jgi:CHAD domain-containing protein
MARRKSPPQNVRQFAATALTERLATVQRRLRKAAKKSDHEPIHQLRVATRRAKMALAAFAPLLANKRRRWFEKQLKKLRRAAGEARDVDICRLRFARHKTELPKGVEAALTKQRRRAQEKIERLEKQFDAKAWKKKQQDLLSATTDAQPLADFALQALQPMLTAFIKAVKSPDRSARQLHALRIAGKQLRYALELLGPVIRKRACKVLLTQLERLQDILGDINDYATIVGLLDDLLEDVSGGKARKWLKAERMRVRESFSERRAKFLRGWTARERLRWEKLCAKCGA